MPVHLCVHTSYSLLESTVTVEEYVKLMKEYGFQAAAVSDRHVMHAAAPFIHACEKYGIKPLIGLEITCLWHGEKVVFLALARNSAGFCDLQKMSTLLCSEREHCTEEELKLLGRSCIIIAYGEGGWCDGDLLRNDDGAVLQKLQILKDELGTFTMALSYQESALWKQLNAKLKRMCRSYRIPTCALNKIAYLYQGDEKIRRVLHAIRDGKTLDDADLPLIKGRYCLNMQEMYSLYEADDIAETDRIAASVTADYTLGKTGLPHFVSRQNIPAQEYLPKLCAAGLSRRLNGNVSDIYKQRLQYELSVIRKMHFEDYFLIVYDFIRYAKKNGIMTGPGRGSAAGSLCAWCLGITEVDPIRYGLLFERFLNPQRVSMPDIDTDFIDERRDEVIAYVSEKYGIDHVADIVTFGTFGARLAVRDVAKVMNLSQRDTDAVLRRIPNAAKTTLASLYEKDERFRSLISSERKYRELYSYAVKIEGLPKHTSIHPAGIIMSSLPLNEVIPLMRTKDGLLTSQYTMGYLEERGLIKMDFLGLHNLTIIDDVMKLVHREDPEFALEDISLADLRVSRLFSTADTAGVFQFESEGMKSLLRRLRPQTFTDVVDALALYRPASMESIPQYIENKKDPQNIVYPLESLRPVLRETYGIMIYQEQAMLTAQIAAGFSLSRADILRKAMSKKNEKELSALQNEFMNGCRRNGVDEKTAEHLYSLVSAFGGYGFNKSHAVAYGLIAYRMAYLKAVWPHCFYTALLSGVMGSTQKTSAYIDECRRKQIRLAAPDVNRSGTEYMLEENVIVLPLSIIKGVGVNTASVIVKEREENGPFTDFFSFAARMLMHKVSRAVLEALVDAGALDCFGQGRRTLLASMDDAIRYAELIQIRNGTQISIDLGLVNVPPMIRFKDSEEEMSEREREVLGFNLGTQPVALMRRKMDIDVPSIAAIRQSGGWCTSFGVIRTVHQHRTKKGDMMCFLNVSDETGDIDLTVMPKLYAQCGDHLMRGTYILFSVKMTEERSPIVQKIEIVRKRQNDENTDRG
ncbi:MAG: DNA polymerase III subunit alpha [Solobacterium sp.]|nr:DNA polymerase III subunit alpha [Solobacterium sp.]